MDFINIIFRCIDFVVIVGLFYFAIHRYLLSMIEKLMREYTLLIYNLKSDCLHVQSQSQSIKESIQDQEQQFEIVQSKFVIWQKESQVKTDRAIQEQLKIDHAIQERFAERSACIKNSMILQKQFPIILESVTSQLQAKYDSVELQKKYIDELILALKEKS